MRMKQELAEQRVKTAGLEKQLIEARDNFVRQLAAAEARLAEYSNKGVVGSKLMQRGQDLHVMLSTKAGSKEVAEMMAADGAEKMHAGYCEEVVISRRVQALVSHLEAELFGAGAGDVRRTQLLLLALLDRTPVKQLLTKHAPTSQKSQAAAAAVLSEARQVL